MFSKFTVNHLYLIGFAYLLGAVPWGIVLTRLFTAKDIRKTGSGNIGATNVLRVAGKLLGFFTLVLDISKGAFPVYLSDIMYHTPGTERDLMMVLVTFAAILGHVFPVYLKFKGGKGVATAAGCFLVLSPISLAIALLVFTVVLAVTRRVSAGSVSAATVLPVAVLSVSGSWIFTGCTALISLLVLIAHQENIRRLIAGTEPEIRLKNKKD